MTSDKRHISYKDNTFLYKRMLKTFIVAKKIVFLHRLRNIDDYEGQD